MPAGQSRQAPPPAAVPWTASLRSLAYSGSGRSATRSGDRTRTARIRGRGRGRGAAVDRHGDRGTLLVGEAVPAAAVDDLLGVQAALRAAVDAGEHHAVARLVQEGGRERQFPAAAGEGVVAGEAYRPDHGQEALAQLGGLAADQVERAA